MPTREIPRDEWIEFFADFSRQHRGWLVSVSVTNADGARTDAPEASLKQIVAETNAGADDKFSVVVHEAAEERIAHTVFAPTRVALEETEAGAHRKLTLENGSGERTEIRFRAAVLPEMVDGIAPEEMNG